MGSGGGRKSGRRRGGGELEVGFIDEEGSITIQCNKQKYVAGTYFWVDAQ